MRLRHYLPFIYFVSVLLSGVLNNPLSALIIGFLYWVGFIGIAFVYVSRKQEEWQMRWGYMALGITLIIFCYLWIEATIYYGILGDPNN